MKKVMVQVIGMGNLIGKTGNTSRPYFRISLPSSNPPKLKNTASIRDFDILKLGSISIIPNTTFI